MDVFSMPLTLKPNRVVGRLVEESGNTPIPEAIWYSAEESGDGLLYRFPAGALATSKYLSADTLLDGNHLVTFVITMQEEEDGSAFELSYGLLNQCSARIRIPLEAVDQNRWRYEREGAWLKPICRGEIVNLAKVDRLMLQVERKAPGRVRWCLTPLVVSSEEPPTLKKPILCKGPLLDELGQSTLHAWPGKSHSSNEVTNRLREQLAAVGKGHWPECFSRWGGWLEKRLEGSGFFHTQHDGKRWWIVDPDGYVFWSSGMDCVSVDTEAAYNGLETALTWLPKEGGPYDEIFSQSGPIKRVNYLAANLIRAFGSQNWYQKWAQIALDSLRGWGFNTVANWSDWEIAHQAGFPYVRPLEHDYLKLPLVFRDFPDVFHSDFPAIADAFAEPLRATKDDKAFIGYFLMNEPNWGFAKQTPASGMLWNTPACATRLALASFLRERYGDEISLANAWGRNITFALIAESEWHHPLTRAAHVDLADFSAVMVERFLGGLSQACRAVDPNHLNLGIRYYTIPPDWALAGMRHFDVFSMNCYKPQVPAQDMAKISTILDMPIMIGEWHFGALDAGLPACGIGHVPDQEGRAKAFRVYLEDAAAKPWCVGAHYFILYDQSAIGRFDGENYNIGFLDVCNRPYDLLVQAAQASHECLYQVASGESMPYDDKPEYLPLIFM